MAMTFLLHADDIGLSPGITRAIVRAIDEGFVRSVSLIANGTGFDEAIVALKARPSVRVTLHLNLLEGEPLSAPGDIPLLVDVEGRLAATYENLVQMWATGGAGRRHALREQMQREFSAQIAHGWAALETAGIAGERLRIDSHTHIHTLPFVLDAVLACPTPRPIGYVRVPREPWHVSPSPEDRAMLLGLNPVKWALTNALSRRMAAKLENRGIAYNRAFVGVLHTGRMTVTAVEAGVRAMLKAEANGGGRGGSEPVEVLVHPGNADPEEQGQWRGRPELWAYYNSPHRALEARTAREIGASPVLKAHFESV